MKITESQLKKIITKSTMKLLRENEDNSNWYGCPNIRMIYHGNWADPELEANGHVANYWDIEDTWWRQFLEETGHSDSEANDPQVEEEFAQFLRSNEPSIIDDIANADNSSSDVYQMNESTLRMMVMEAVQKLLEDEDGVTIEQVPDWAMNYLFNGDNTDLDDEDMQNINQWENEMIESGYDLGLMDTISDEPYFSHYPAFGKGCMVYDVAIRAKSM